MFDKHEPRRLLTGMWVTDWENACHFPFPAVSQDRVLKMTLRKMLILTHVPVNSILTVAVTPKHLLCLL